MNVIAESKPHHGFNVKVARMKRKGWKQSALGENLNLTQEQISRLENQEVIKDEMLEKIAKVLDCSVDYLKSENLEELMGSYTGSQINNTDVTLTTGENAQVQEFVQQKSQTIQEQTVINQPIKELKDVYEEYAATKYELGRMTAKMEFYKEFFDKNNK